jgi:hypothetical protein
VLDEAGLTTPLRLTLHKLLLQYIQLINEHQLLAEIHQSGLVMGKVQAVIPNTPEAEQMILMMNKNFPAYVGHVLRDQGLPDGFLMGDLFIYLALAKPAFPGQFILLVSSQSKEKS